MPPHATQALPPTAATMATVWWGQPRDVARPMKLGLGLLQRARASHVQPHLLLGTGRPPFKEMATSLAASPMLATAATGSKAQLPLPALLQLCNGKTRLLHVARLLAQRCLTPLTVGFHGALTGYTHQLPHTAATLDTNVNLVVLAAAAKLEILSHSLLTACHWSVKESSAKLWWPRPTAASQKPLHAIRLQLATIATLAMSSLALHHAVA